jgi:hypothetical protein
MATRLQVVSQADRCESTRRGGLGRRDKVFAKPAATIYACDIAGMRFHRHDFEKYDAGFARRMFDSELAPARLILLGDV